MTPTNLSAQLRYAYQLIQTNRRSEAYVILVSLVREHPYNPDIWWLLAHAVNNLSHTQKALQRVLAIDPFYPQAAERLAQVNQQIAMQMARAAASQQQVNPYYIPPSLRTGQPSPAMKRHSQQSWRLTFVTVMLTMVTLFICVGLIALLNGGTEVRNSVSQFIDEQGIVPFIGAPVNTPDPDQFGDTYWNGIGDGITMDTQSVNGRYLRFYEFPIKVYVDGANNSTWQNAVSSAVAEIDQVVEMELTTNRDEADVVLTITSQSRVQTECSTYTRARVVGCASINYEPGILRPTVFGEAYVSTSTNNPTGTIMHELLHAIGVAAHSLNRDDIMYFEETNYIVVKMSQRDINTLARLYASPSLVD